MVNSGIALLLAIIPALIVGATCWYLLKSFFQNERHQRNMEWKAKASKDTLALRLQAYERLTLLCERCDLMPLILRMQTTDMNASDLHAALMIGITQEFDHNVTQQIYVSETLWKLITTARSETMEMLNVAKQKSGANASREAYIDSLFEVVGQLNSSPFQKALHGIRLEANALVQ